MQGRAARRATRRRRSPRRWRGGAACAEATAVPQTPLLSRRWWLVIDEAQAVQSRSTTPTMLAAMAARIDARRRWCVTGLLSRAQRR